MRPEDVTAALAPWFAETLGASEIAIRDVTRHAEGWSWQTWTMTVVADGAPQGFAVRREPEDGLLAPYDTAGQFRLHRAVIDHSAVPMPGLRWLEISPDVLGMPFYVMERVEGRVPVQWQGDDPEIFPTDDVRTAIGHHFVDVLADIHTIDPAVTGLPVFTTSDEGAAAQVEHWAGVYERSALVEVPILRWLVGWLRANIATSGRVTVVHGDYRIGNFMVRDDEIVAVFDWELAHVGDPLFDLAWAAMPLFRGRGTKVSQLLDESEFLTRYADRSGHPIDRDVFRFWLLFGHLRAAVPQLRAAKAFEDGAPDLRLGAMGHQYLYVLRQLVDELGWR